MWRDLHRSFAKGRALFYGACLQKCPPFFQPVLRHVQCVVQASNPGTFTTLGQYLYECGLKPNTVSTYMRMLRSIYNRGVEAGSAPYVPRLFHDVYTGVDVRQKKALPVTELRKLLYEDPQSERLRHTQAIAALMFQFCGMSLPTWLIWKSQLWTGTCCGTTVSRRKLRSVWKCWIPRRR